jgi:hypothetical protein
VSVPPDLAKIVEIPEEIRHVFGEVVPGTRMYRAEGPEGTSGPWFEAVCEIAGRCVSPGGASMFAPVSRAAVHKRVKEGKLTAFCFYITKTSTGIFGKQRQTRETPLVYIPIGELKLWAAELEERMIRLGRITREEVEGDKPDWEGKFWEWRSKWQEQKRKEYEK